MKIVVTGSSGLVGELLSARLVDSGHGVLPIDLVGGHPQDFRQWAAGACRVPFDGVVHLAAISRVAWGEAQPDLCSSINVAGTQVLCDMLATHPAQPWLLFASSREVYGDPVSPVVFENDPLLPVNHYGRSKLEGERLVQRFRADGGQAAILRLSSVYGGRRDHPDRAIPALVQRALSGEPLRLTGADHYFDFVHVAGVVDGIVRTIELLAAGERALPPVHLASGVATSLRQLAEEAVSATGSASPIIETPARSFDVAGFCGSPERAQRLLGWKATTSLAEGVRQVADNLRRAGPLTAVLMPLA